jgi:hypothetical protein
MSELDTAPPIACTLDMGSFKTRLAWITALNARALTTSRRGDLALRWNTGAKRWAMSESWYAGSRLAAHSPTSGSRSAATNWFSRSPHPKRRVTPRTCCSSSSRRRVLPRRRPPAAALRNAKHDRAQGTKAASAVAVTASTAALACGVCCVLPFAVRAAILGSIGGVLARFAEAYRWLTPIALVAVGAGWAWVGYHSWRTRRSPAHSTLLVMTFATIMIVAAWIWPMIESTIITLAGR